MDYQTFLDSKQFADVASGFTPTAINPALFDFQQALVHWACQRGRAALFADTGLGKTAMQVEWARLVTEHTGGSVLILAPLCVAQQTVAEAERFGIAVTYTRNQPTEPGIWITNYEMLARFDPSAFVGVVLDESSILKAHDSKTRQALIEAFSRTPYRLSCTATPSPNDHMELGNQAEFLGVMSAVEMLAMFFTHDGGNTSQWRLKGHGKTRFWGWMSTWAACVRNPADLGFDGSRYALPPLHMHEHQVEGDFVPEGQLFAAVAQTLSERRSAKRESLEDRVAKAAKLVNASDEPWIVWCHLNDESTQLARLIPDAVEVTGSLSMDEKERRIMAFTNGEARVIVTKPSIAGFGLNWQHCADMAFVGLDDSFEAFYQAIRRAYRFGQKRPVNVHLIASEAEGAIKANLERKQDQANEMAESMVAHMRDLTRQQITGTTQEKTDYTPDRTHAATGLDSERSMKEKHMKVLDQAFGDNWALYNGDCVEVVGALPDASIDYTIYSPPFESLYTYSNSDRDFGNSSDRETFWAQYRFLISEHLRVTKPGRLVSIHCMNLPTSKFRDGVIGLRDFRGEIIRAHEDAGWIFHSEVCIWKDPVTAMQRTKALGLLHKTIRKDSSMSRQGIPDYLVTMRKPGDNPEPISHTSEEFPVRLWQRYASPVWMDINPSRTLQYRSARENDDERHICPLQLDVIERGIQLWSNPSDLVLSPFAGIGSEGYTAIKMGRRFVGAELKRSYWELACRNLESANLEQHDLFSTEAV